MGRRLGVCLSACLSLFVCFCLGVGGGRVCVCGGVASPPRSRRGVAAAFWAGRPAVGVAGFRGGAVGARAPRSRLVVWAPVGVGPVSASAVGVPSAPLLPALPCRRLVVAVGAASVGGGSVSVSSAACSGVRPFVGRRPVRVLGVGVGPSALLRACAAALVLCAGAALLGRVFRAPLAPLLLVFLPLPVGVGGALPAVVAGLPPPFPLPLRWWARGVGSVPVRGRPLGGVLGRAPFPPRSFFRARRRRRAAPPPRGWGWWLLGWVVFGVRGVAHPATLLYVCYAGCTRRRINGTARIPGDYVK